MKQASKMRLSKPCTSIAQACLVAVLAMLLFEVVSSRARGDDRGFSWTGTWATSPLRDDAASGFTRQTLRQIVHTSIGGHKARIHISNLFGTQPLTVADVHLARRSTGSAIVAPTDRKVQFAGLPSVTVPPGTEAISDPVDFQIPRLADVAISFYLPNSIGPATYHPSGFQTNYIADGDVSGSTSISPVKTVDRKSVV